MTRGETGGRRTTADVRGGQAPTLRTIVDSADVTGTDATTGLTYQIIRPDQLATAPWRTLNTFALTPAPFYDPVFLRAVSGFGRGDLQLMIVRDPAENGMLRAIWPFNTIPLGPVSSLRANVTFSSHYSPTAVPIVAQGEAERTIATALRGFASVAPVLVTPNLPLESALAKTLITTLDAGHFAHTVTGRNDRTVFSGPAVFREYAAAHWSQNRRQRIRKSMRRLSEEGLVDFRIASAANPWPG
ncbi:MAG: hypothetical protein KDJ77_18970, partial [Rhodobiaceae bacterium]|nr:hypothetical protein [Rhodobiaceae bacterium]